MELLYFMGGIGLGTLFGVTVMAVMQVTLPPKKTTGWKRTAENTSKFVNSASPLMRKTLK